MSLVDAKRFRWYGVEGEEHPDVGDVLVLSGSDPEKYLLVHGSAQVRGGTEDDLWLAITRHQVDAKTGGIPDEVIDAHEGGARFIYYIPGRPRRDSIKDAP